MRPLFADRKRAVRKSALLLFALLAGCAPAGRSGEVRTATPIRHVIVIIGENRTFDHLFATYRPPAGETVSNLLSKGIIREDGSPGPQFALAAQYRAMVTSRYAMHPAEKSVYDHLPPPRTDGTPTAPSDARPPFKTLAEAQAHDTALAPEYEPLLLTGASGLPHNVVDRRIANAAALPSGPFPLQPIHYDEYAASPVHRFYQMWQQLDCDIAQATPANPSGCAADLFPWVEVTVGAGSNGKPQPAGFDAASTGEGATAMGFYNVATGDAPYLTYLARNFALSDNYHQPVLGGTGANHVALGTGDAIWYSDAAGNPATPPANEIENPDPQPGTNNYYRQDGYGGGSYSNCADADQPGVAAITAYLASLPYQPASRCEPGHFYLLNNYDPGYFGDGTRDSDPFAIPPSRLRTIGDALNERGIGWRYYGEGWNDYVRDPKHSVYCNICNPFQYVGAIMTDPAQRAEHLKDTEDLYADIAAGTLPAVAFVKPGEINDGHPASSKIDLFEGFVKKIVDGVEARPGLWADTAIFVTFDEGGGYYDSGYIQPLDFFGDGPRVPLIVVSPFTRGGHVSHQYADHVSLLKFIERNWRLPPVTARSRDNFPNPVTSPRNPYAPVNAPALGDLFDLFRFSVSD